MADTKRLQVGGKNSKNAFFNFADHLLSPPLELYELYGHPKILLHQI